MQECIDPVKTCTGLSLKKRDLSMKIEEEIKRWTAKRQSALAMDIIHGKTTVAEASRTHDLTLSKIENWVDDAKRGMENCAPRMCASNTNASCANCRKPTGSPCWSCVPEQSYKPCWTRTGSDPARAARSGG